MVPLELHNHTDAAKTMTIAVKLPEGWMTQSGAGNLSLDPQSDDYWQVMLDAPKAETKERQEIECTATAEGKVLATIKISVRLGNGGLPQN